MLTIVPSSYCKEQTKLARQQSMLRRIESDLKRENVKLHRFDMIVGISWPLERQHFHWKSMLTLLALDTVNVN